MFFFWHSDVVTHDRHYDSLKKNHELAVITTKHSFIAPLCLTLGKQVFATVVYSLFIHFCAVVWLDNHTFLLALTADLKQ